MDLVPFAGGGEVRANRIHKQARRTTMRTLMTRTIVAAAAMVMLPAMASAQYSSNAEKKPMKNIVQVAVEAGSFETLVAAVKAAGLAETLSGPGPFTVFAPSDAAFAKLPAGTVDALLKDKEQLTAILTYHVVPGKVMAGDIVKANGAEPKTVNGMPLDIELKAGKVYVNGAQVTTADVQASNGVIHIIDTVLLPKTAGAAGTR
jgi:uncharacterized surface protein with fasciclin (FAS1) repeats